MFKLIVGYTLSIGLWVGTAGFLMLAMTSADTPLENQFPTNIGLFSLAIVLIILPICLLIWSIRGIKNRTISKAASGITIIAGLYMAFLIFFVGEKVLSIYIEHHNNMLEEQRQFQEKLKQNNR